MSGEGIGRCTVYRFFGADDVLLYVGIANDIGSRFAAHRRRSSWWDEVVRGTVTVCASRAEAELVEGVAIRTERPAYNVARTTEAKMGRLHAAAGRGQDGVLALVAEVERLRRQWGDAYVRLAMIEGELAQGRWRTSEARHRCVRAQDEVQLWKDAYYRSEARWLARHELPREPAEDWADDIAGLGWDPADVNVSEEAQGRS